MKKLKIEKSQIGKVITTIEDHIVYKKVTGSTANMINQRISGIAILWIPKGSKIVVPRAFNRDDEMHNRKLRCNEAVCLAILPVIIDDETNYIEWNDNFKYRSKHRRRFKYEMGQHLVPTRPFNDSIFSFCKSGIHFFESVEDAENY